MTADLVDAGAPDSVTAAELYREWSKLEPADRRSAFAHVLFVGSNAPTPHAQQRFRQLVRDSDLATINNFLERCGSKSRITAPHAAPAPSSADKEAR